MSVSGSISSVMRPHPVTVRPHHSVRSAAAVLLDHAIDAAPVVTAEGEMRGVVDEIDLIRGLSGDPDEHATTVADVMTPAPPTVGPDEAARRAVDLVLDGARIVPVLDHGHLVGVVDARDVVGWLVAHEVQDGPNEIPGRAAIYEAITRASAMSA